MHDELRGTNETDVGGSDNPGRQESTTLSPDWLDRLTSGAVQGDVAVLPRAQGATAGIARWIAVADDARARHERRQEREACWWVASHLAESDRDLGVALAHARRALELGGEDAWRVQVSTWLERIGQHREAAAVLAPCVNQANTAREAARLLLRMARMQVRGDDHRLATQNLLESATVWPAYADALDLAGELAAVQGRGEAASMLLEAGDRHEENGNRQRAFESRRRAFEAAPANVQACNALADSLERAERPEAADGVRRVHAAASDEPHAKTIHALRLSRAIEANETARALSAVVDGKLGGETGDEVGRHVDEALSRAGLHDAIAARWELKTSRLSGAERARVFVELAGLYLGRLASPDRAVDSWIEALAADPTCGEARAALRTHARTMHDQTALAEALIRAAKAHAGTPHAQDCLREIATLAEERLSEPSMAYWAYEQLAALGVTDEQTEKAKHRLTPRVRLQETALASARQAALGQGDVRLEGWRRIAAILRGRPDEVNEYLEVLAHLVRAGQGERRWWVDFERAAIRADRQDLFVEVIRERLRNEVPRADVVYLRSLLIALAWRRGDVASVLDDARALSAALPGTRAAHAHAWIASTVLGDTRARADALEHCAANLAASVRATLLAMAGELQRELGDDEATARLANAARRSDLSAPRVLQFLTSVAKGDGDFARNLEKLSSVYVPCASHHAELVRCFQNEGQHDLAHTWVRRWLELRPWDPEVAELLITTAAASAIEVHVAAIVRVTTCALSLEQLVPLLCRGLETLRQRDLMQAAKVARDLCDLYGARHSALRDVFVDIARAADDPRFEARVLERWLASREAPDDPATWLRLVELYERIDEVEAATRALGHAARAGADPNEVKRHSERFETATSGDALLNVLAARARAASRLGDDGEAVAAWLQLGSARWERADDRPGAIEAWLSGLGGADAAGFARLSDALAKFAGKDLAVAALRKYASSCGDPSKRASALVVAAARSLPLNQPRPAIEMAMEALREDPRRTDALVIVERASDRAGAPSAIDEAHALAASGAKGRFGRRAAHFRAARTLEQRNHPELALVHAMAAFEADPVEGSSLVMMLRLAAVVEPTEVVAALCRVAEQSDSVEARAHWWMHAARLTAGRPEHARQSLDLSLRALLAVPNVESVEIMREVMQRLVELEPDDATIFELRLQRAHKALASKLEGPTGGRVALATSLLCASVLRTQGLAMTWLRTAFACSGDIDEYETLAPHAQLFAAEPQSCAAFIDDVLARNGSLSGTTGPSLIAFARVLAEATRDSERIDKLSHAEAAATSDVDPAPIDPFADLAEELAADSDHPPVEPEPEPVPEVAEPEPPKQTLPPGTWPAHPAPHERPPIEAPQPDGLSRIAEAERLERMGEVGAAIEQLEGIEADGTLRARVDEVLVRLYEAAGRNTQLAVVLERVVERAEDPGLKVRLLVRMAGLREARGDYEAARATWQAVTELDPTRSDAWQFLERDATERGEYGLLAQILLRRSMAASTVAEIRALRLRRAQVLEQELGLPDQARSELDELAAELGADAAVLQYRAQLAERVGGPVAAAPFWVRAAAMVPSRQDGVALLCQAARAYLDAAHLDEARNTLAMTDDVRTAEVLGLFVDLDRKSGATMQLGEHLQELAELGGVPDATRGGWLLEAAELASVIGDIDVAVDRARRAARMAPREVEIQLRSVYLTYRLEGLAKREHVVEMLDRLNAIVAIVPPDAQDLHAFLSAECLELLRGPEAAIELLHERKRVAGVGPLIALALADRLAAMGDQRAALPLFDVALDAPSLQGVRTRAQVAFTAARAALRAGGSQLAQPYVAIVEGEPGAEQMVDRLRTEMAELVPPTDEVRRQLDRLARTSRGVDRAKALVQLARLASARSTKASYAEAEGYYVEAIAAASSDPQYRRQLIEERLAFRGQLTPSVLPPPAVATDVSSVPPPPRAPTFATSPSTLIGTPPMPLSSSPSTPPGREGALPPRRPSAEELPLTSTISSQPPPPDPIPLSSPKPPSVPAVATPTPPDAVIERRLFEALAAGDLEAGDQLASMLADMPDRAHDIVAIRRRQVVLQPASIRHLELLRDAAKLDHNPGYAAAVHHVVCAFTGQAPPPPPPLQHQVADPERIFAMVHRGVHGPAAEVMAEIWRYASHLFVREPADYGLTGLERVSMSSPSPVGRAYGAAARVLGLVRTPVFQRRSHGPMNLAVAVLSPLAVVVTGDVGDDDVLLFRMAAMLAATTPENGMLFGLPANAIRQLMNALLAAFGPPDRAKSRVSGSAVLAGELWRALPGSVQRRFGQLYRDADPFTYEDAWARALQSTRRAGLLVVGDLKVALDEVRTDPGVRESVDAGAADAYRLLCRVSVSAADLVRFASSSEYAELRWQQDRRSSDAWRSFRE